jgi:hypothetical protein
MMRGNLFGDDFVIYRHRMTVFEKRRRGKCLYLRDGKEEGGNHNGEGDS